MSKKRSAALPAIVALSAVTMLAATGCGSVRTNPNNLGNVQTGQPDSGTGDTVTLYPDRSTGSAAHAGGPADTGERYNEAQEEDIANKSLAAWRIATSHDKQGDASDKDWKATRAADEKSAMDQLTALSKAHPGSSTVTFMMGQVEEHFGKNEKAAEYFKAATLKNTHSTMYTFKLAQAQRRAGETDKAIDTYRQLLAQEPNFVAGQVGLAKCLLAKDPHSKEAADLATKAVANDPSSKDAQQLLNEIKGDKSGK